LPPARRRASLHLKAAETVLYEDSVDPSLLAYRRAESWIA
jgi:hypothetical protein